MCKGKERIREGRAPLHCVTTTTSSLKYEFIKQDFEIDLNEFIRLRLSLNTWEKGSKQKPESHKGRGDT
jgi:hypothetical protein